MDWLLDAVLKRLVKTRNLTVVTAKGRTLSYGDGSGPPCKVRFTSPRWQTAVVLDPELKLGEAYMDGGLIVDQGSIADFLDIVIYHIAKQRPTLWGRLIQQSRSVVRAVFQFNNMFRAKRNAEHHYNIDSRIYRLFLDPDMQYSCAYFENMNDTIEVAQQAKKRHIINKLFMNREGLRVLDIGCGWGGMGLEIARKAKASVVGINLSSEQIKIARERAEKEKLPCDFRIQDYRDVSEKFDRIVSVGMFEHVGKRYYDAFMRKSHEVLADDGVMLLHTIARWDGPSDTNAWVWRYIFPGGYAPSLSELAPAIERSGLIINDIEVLRIHYAETLRCWRERFLEQREEVLKIFDERFIRMWEFYLAGFEPCFRYYGLMVLQIQMTKSLDVLPLSRDYMYATKTGQTVARAATSLRAV